MQSVSLRLSVSLWMERRGAIMTHLDTHSCVYFENCCRDLLKSYYIFNTWRQTQYKYKKIDTVCLEHLRLLYSMFCINDGSKVSEIWKGSLIVTTDYYRPVSSVERFSIFQPIVLVFWAATLPSWFTLTALVVLFSATACSCFHQNGLWKPTVHYLLTTKQQQNKVSDQLVNIVEHLAVQEPDISLRTWWIPRSDRHRETLIR